MCIPVQKDPKPGKRQKKQGRTCNFPTPLKTPFTLSLQTPLTTSLQTRSTPSPYPTSFHPFRHNRPVLVAVT